MSEGVVLDLAPQRDGPCHLLCCLVIDILSDHEERGRNLELLDDVKHLRRRYVIRAVVEAQCDKHLGGLLGRSFVLVFFCIRAACA